MEEIPPDLKTIDFTDIKESIGAIKIKCPLKSPSLYYLLPFIFSKPLIIVGSNLHLYYDILKFQNNRAQNTY